MRVEKRSTQFVIPVCIILLAAGLRWGYLAGAPHGIQLTNVDATGYHYLAVNMLEHGIYSLNSAPPWRADNIRAPLYPLFVAFWYAIGGPNPDCVAFVQPLLDVLTVVVLLKFGTLIAGPRVGRLAALLYALNPSSWRFCNELLTEILFGLLLTAGLWMFARYLLYWRQRDALRCGVLLGAGILCKPNIQFLPLALLALLAHGIFVHRQGWWHGAVIVAGTIGVLLLPWLVRNAIVFGEIFYTRTFDDNLAHVSAVATLAHVNGEAVAPWTPRWEEIYGDIIVETAQRYGWEPLPETALSTRERDRRLKETAEVAKEIVRTYPVDFIVSHTQSWLRSFVPQDYKFWYARLTGQVWETAAAQGDVLGRVLAVLKRGEVVQAVRMLIDDRLYALPGLAFVFWAWWGIVYAVAGVLLVIGGWRMRPRLLAVFLFITIFYVTFVPGPISQIRFRLPVTPLILLLVARGCYPPGRLPR
ncbi:MAG TPA: glycosyltransferase family 39 protein [Anaerolineae bacterium]|nr:glycosyltransferase family 39 protein [Anaerolineae bacterium]HQH39081.1 glycosyltransferase family 39 protein [Anaerolineae bacterium]